jgi:uncharacterized protein
MTQAPQIGIVEDVGMMRAGNETRKGDWMEVYSGIKFFPLDPRPEEISLVDIAHHLSRINRYNGACQIEHYSVAEHSVLMAHALYREGVPPEVAYQALFHDAAEAYIGDMVRPLKRQPEMVGFCAAEILIWRAIVDSNPVLASFKEAVGYELDRRVKEADNRILVDERAQCMAPSTNTWGIGHLEPLGVKIKGWKPSVAKILFLEAATLYRKLSGFECD